MTVPRFSVSLWLTACVVSGAAAQSPPAPRSPDSPRYDRATFRWFDRLVGTWCGSGEGGLAHVPVFFERYVALDDSSLTQRSYADSTFQTVTDSSVIVHRNERIILIPAAGNALAVVGIGSDTAVFAQRSGSPLTLRMLDRDRWRAEIPSGPGGQPSAFVMKRAVVGSRCR